MGKPQRENRERQRAMQLSFKKRKACIVKKTMELSVLCDIQACAVIVDGNGEVTPWPENQSEVMKVLQRYRAWCSSNDLGMERKEVPPAEPNDEWVDSVIEDLLKEPWDDFLNTADIGSNDDDIMINDNQRMLVEVDSKIHAVMERIEFLKSKGEEYKSIQAPPLLLEYHPEQSIQMVPITPGSYDVQSGIGTTQTPCFSEYSPNQDSTFYVPTMPSPSEVQSAGETFQDPCFFEYDSDQHSILDMATMPYFFQDVPLAFAEQGFPDIVPQFLGDNSEHKMSHMVPEPGCFGEISEQIDPQLSSMNWNYDLFSFNGY